MQITRTIELNEEERKTIEKFFSIADKISDVAGCSMCEVFEYFSDVIEIIDDYEYRIGILHQIADMK